MVNLSNSEEMIRLLNKYNKPGPRYTSYPTAPEWKNDFLSSEYTEQIEEFKNNDVDKSLSIYNHIPFCEERCLYCGCHVIIDKNRHYVDSYLDYLEKEINLVKEILGKKYPVRQLHWGGGTPTFLKEHQIERLFGILDSSFHIEKDSEIAIEIDPCVTSKEQIKCLSDLGFNRISMGVQDFNPLVQQAVHRVQPYQLTEELINYSREVGFKGVNLDFIYGLPLQTVESFSKTVNQIIDLSPDRIALFSYAKVPWLKPHQKKMDENDFPSADEKFKILLSARKKLIEEGGYDAIGMDHFALQDDEIAISFKNKELYRNFMGYTVQKTGNFLGIGVSSIGYVNQCYIQNIKTLKEYYSAIDQNLLPVDRGLKLNEDDLIRQWVINSLMCQFELDFGQFENQFRISFESYFREELVEINTLVYDNFIEISEKKILVTELGSLFVRNIAMLFDKYLKNKQVERRFSQTV